jgi:RNA-directed DNA polymerase
MNRRQLRAHCSLESLCSESNLLLAADKARKHKSRRPDVERWWLVREREINRLRSELLAETWRPSGYRFFTIHEPKRRLIAAAPFADRVVHHALCNVMQPLLERRFVARSFSCQIGKGTSAAREVCRELTNRHAFVLKCDIHKFFPSIDHTILREKLSREICCPGVLRLIGHLLASHVTDPWDIPPSFFAGDDLIDAACRPRGLPIGNLTSQLWGNFFLDSLDHWITETERHGAYLRYTDDFLLFGNDKDRLWELRAEIVRKLADIRLRLAVPKSRLLATREGFPFCGFRFLPGLRPRILGATKRRFETRRHRLYRTGMPMREIGLRVFAWYQFSREANSEGLRRSYCGWPLNGRQRKRRKKFRPLRGGKRAWRPSKREEGKES